MSFRARLTLYVAAAIAVTVAGASFAVWVVAKHELYAQLDSTLYQQVNQPGPFGGAGGSAYTVVIHPDGDRTGLLAEVLPVTSRVTAVANGNAGAYFTDLVVRNVALRELVWPNHGGGAVMSVQPLAPTQH